MVPGSTFIPGCVDAVRGSHGGQAGGEVVGRRGLTSNPSIMSSTLFSAICCNRQSVVGQQRGAYVEEAADGADHEAGLVEARDACGGIAGGAADEVRAEELHIGHGKELFGVKDAISLAMYVKTHEYPSLYPFPGAQCGYMSWSIDVPSKY